MDVISKEGDGLIPVGYIRLFLTELESYGSQLPFHFVLDLSGFLLCAINEDHEIVAVADVPEFGVVSGIIHGYVLSLPLQFAELLQEFCAFFPFWGFSEFLADIYDTLLYLCVLGIPSCFPFLVGLSPVCP